METSRHKRRQVPFVFFSVELNTDLLQHNLPELRNINAIQHLDPQEATAYLTGYGVGYVHYIAEQKRRIGPEIGCPVEIPDIQV